MKQTEQRRRVMTLGGLLMLAAFLATGMHPARAADAPTNKLTLTFKYTVVQGTCTLNVPATLDMGKITDAGQAIGKDWVFLNKRDLTVTLSDCTGTASPATRPAIQLLQLPAAATGSAARKQYLAVPENGTSGFGVVLAQKGKEPTNGGVTGLVPLDHPDATYIDIGAPNTVAQNGPVTLKVALACGDATDCVTTNMAPDADTVSIAFAFKYH